MVDFQSRDRRRDDGRDSDDPADEEPEAAAEPTATDYDSGTVPFAVVTVADDRSIAEDETGDAVIEAIEAAERPLLLFGGGITLSALMESSGASAFMAQGLGDMLPAGRDWLVYLAIAAFALLLTELASNTASAALLVPLFMPVATHLGADPAVAAVLVGTSASCALMLPVATPPNALVFGSGAVPQSAMVRTGFYASVLAAAVLL